MRIKPHQFQHHANAVVRIKQCIENCKLPAKPCGTIFSLRFNKTIGIVALENNLNQLIEEIERGRFTKKLKSIFSPIRHIHSHKPCQQ